jgi:hypothetical protein
MARAMWHDMENAMDDWKRMSQHFHIQCEHTDWGKHQGGWKDESQHVCGATTEMEGMILLHVMLGPREEALLRASSSSQPRRSEEEHHEEQPPLKMEFCQDCPDNMIPLQIKPRPSEAGCSNVITSTRRGAGALKAVDKDWVVPAHRTSEEEEMEEDKSGIKKGENALDDDAAAGGGWQPAKGGRSKPKSKPNKPKSKPGAVNNAKKTKTASEPPTTKTSPSAKLAHRPR